MTEEKLTRIEPEQIPPDETDTQDACPHCQGPVRRLNLFVRYPDVLSPVRYRRWYFVCSDETPTRSADALRRGVRTGNGCAWRRPQRAAGDAETAP